MLNEENKDYLQGTIDGEGFAYAMMYYSNYENIKDEKFQELLAAYRLASDNLESYIMSE